MLQKKSGFTLMEIALVIVVISLITGGIFAGQSMLKTQKARAVITDAKTYLFSLQSFQKQYGYLPGDFPTAQQVFGNAENAAAPGTNCASPQTSVSGAVAGTTPGYTCNGDGNGVMSASGGEIYRAWQQLMAAQLINGTYTGISLVAGAYGGTGGVNIPAGSIEGTGYSWVSLGTVDANNTNTALYDGDYDNMLVFGATYTNDYSNGAALTGREAFEIDKKADDGMADTGNIRSFTRNFANTPTCALAGVPANYNSTASSPVCSLIFLTPKRDASQQ